MKWKGSHNAIFKSISPHIGFGQPLALSAYQEYFYLLNDFFTLSELACYAPGEFQSVLQYGAYGSFREVAQNPMFQIVLNQKVDKTVIYFP